MRKLLLPAVLSLGLLIPGESAAKSKHYSGTANPAGTIGFKVIQKRHSKKKRVTGFKFFGIPVNCADGAHSASGVVTTAAKLRHGNFKMSAVNKVTGATLAIHGNLSAGTIQLSGNVGIEPSGTGMNCDSGVLSWTAHRG